MHRVKARSSFDHHGARVPGDEFTVGTKRDAEQLAKKGLVEVVGETEQAEAEPKKGATLAEFTKATADVARGAKKTGKKG